MIENGVDPNNILLFTFTRKAANEIQERVQKQIGNAGKQITVGTYHSFCGKLLRRYADVLGGWNRKFSIYDDNDKDSVLQTIIGKDKKAIAVAKSAISKYKMNLVSPTMAKQIAKSALEKKNANYYERYMSQLKANNAFDFDDLIYFAIRILENNPEIKKYINNKYTYITCDEAHDSSPEDLRLIELLGGSKMNVCLILDDNQSKLYCSVNE